MEGGGDDLFTALLPVMTIGLVTLPVALWLCPKMGARRWLAARSSRSLRD